MISRLSEFTETCNFKMKKPNKNIFLVVVLEFISLSFALGGRVTKITPTSGSLLGATRLTIHGEGFANDQFNWFQNQKEWGNNVTLLSKSRAHVLPCDVITYYTTPYQIVCTTRPSLSGEDSYNIRVTVDGIPLDNSNGNAYCGDECLFKFTQDMTPTITLVTPRYGLPGTLLTIHGKLFTDQVMETEAYDPNKALIERVYAGAGLCEVYDINSKELYGSAVVGQTGYIKCKPTSTIIGSQRASFLVSGYGRSQMSKNAISVDSQGRLYLFQTHADVEDVSPSVGSIAGGTVLTITGKGFDKHAKNISVHVGGVPCKLLDIQSEIIQCQTNPAPSTRLSDGDTMYPGARGLLREVWTNTRPSSVSAVGGLRTSSPDYHSEVVSESSSPAQASFNESRSFSDRYRGFFVPPSDNNYAFFIQANDQAELYLSLNESAAVKTKIASCSKPTTSWTAFAEQKSTVFSLKRGRRYYIEALHVQDTGKSHLSIGVKLQKTRFVNSQIGAAVNEKQEIHINSVKHPEIQVINITNWDDGKKFEVQDVEVISCRRAQGNDTNCADTFSLSYGGLSIAPVLLNNMTAKNLQQALNNLTSIKRRGHTNVTEVIKGNSTTAYRITFYFDDPTDTQMLLNNTLGSNVTSVEITRLQKGVPANYWFKLSLAGRTTSDIHINAEASILKQQLQNLTAWYCSYQIPPERAYYYNGFESSPQGPLWGERVFKTTPNCGQFSLKNPQYLFYGGQSKDIWGRVLKGYSVARYQQLCFSYKGKMKNSINVLVSYTDKSGVDQRFWRSYSVITISDNNWHRLCTNVHDRVLNDKYLKIDTRYKTYVEGIRLTRYSGVDLYVDDVFIWSEAVTVQRLLQAAEPGGNIIESVDVQKLGPNAWSVSLTPSSCGTGLELLQVAQAKVISGNTSSNQTVFRPINATGDSAILASREQAATPPLGGTFDLVLEDNSVKGIPANVSADGLKNILENNFSIGKVSVTRIGTCASYRWTVEWATTGGDQPAIKVQGTGLTGNRVSIQATTVDDGGLFLRPIPGDMLRVADNKPQVTVSLNSIPSSCSKRQCSFTFLSSATPVLTSISPQRGTSATEITLTGSGFSSSAADVNVTIGGVICHVTNASLNTIKCTAGQSIGGQQDVVVKIANQGVAKHSSGKVSFNYRVIASEMQPARGSCGGGTVVTLKGNGFGVTSNGSRVLIGGSICRVINSSLTELSCVTSAHAPGNATVNVTVDGEVGTLSTSFVFDSTLTPSVSSLSISQGSVSGGEELVIKGSGFEVSKTTAQVGPSSCRVTSLNNTQIKCTTAANPPGIYDVKVYVDGKGFAVEAHSGSKLPQFQYILEITGISPLYGSIFGGTVITVTGRGFSDNNTDNAVKIGNVPCEILSSSNTEIVCKTGASYTTHTVDNTGQHPKYGIGYGWNPQTVYLSVGDFVKWKWSSPELSGLTFGVQQTRDSTTTMYDGKGFKSGRSGNGNFSQQFNVPGTYFYSSGSVDPYGAIIMKGRVVVDDLKSNSFDVKVQVGRFVAPYNTSGSIPSDPSPSDCQKGLISAIPQCSAKASIPDSLGFTFWNCSTPEVTSIIPNSGTSSTILTIKGKGFGVDKCFNEVKIGSLGCVVQSSTDKEIKCLVATGNQLIAGVPHRISVRVNNRGFAVIKVENKLNASFVLQPTIQSVYPQSGSVKGGSILTIKGDGFSSARGQTDVHIAGAACKIVSISYNKIQCETSEKKASQALDVEVKVNGLGSHCNSILGCSFSYSAVKTPKVDSVTPSTIVKTNNVISIYGSGLPTKVSDLDVKVGNISCAVMSSSQYSASCRLGPIVAGKHAVRIHVAGQGLAVFEANAPSMIDSRAVVSSITPVEGSIMGGTELFIKGSGFGPTVGHTTVRIGTNYCTIVRVTSSEVVCKTSAHSVGSFEVRVEK